MELINIFIGMLCIILSISNLFRGNVEVVTILLMLAGMVNLYVGMRMM